MTQEHLLSTQNIKNAFVQGRLGLYTEIPAEAIARNEENFDAWLAAHDAQIRADEHVRALELTDRELEIMEDAYSNSDEAYLGKYIEALDIGIKAVAQYRKEQKQ